MKIYNAWFIIFVCVVKLLGQPYGKDILLRKSDTTLGIGSAQALPGGNVLMSWWEWNKKADRSETSQQVFGPNLESVGPAVTLPDGGRSARTLAHENGSYLTFWRDEGFGEGFIYVQHFSAIGEPVGGIKCINPNKMFYSRYYVCNLPDGNFLCAWTIRDYSDVYAQIVSVNGNRIGEHFILTNSDKSIHFGLLSEMKLLNSGTVLIVQQNYMDHNLYIWSPATKMINRTFDPFPEVSLQKHRYSTIEFSQKEILVYGWFEDKTTRQYYYYGKIYNYFNLSGAERFSFKEHVQQVLPFDNYMLTLEGYSGQDRDIILRKYSKNGNFISEIKYNYGYFLRMHKISNEKVLFVQSKIKNNDFKTQRISGFINNPITLTASPSFSILDSPAPYGFIDPLIFKNGDFLLLWGDEKAAYARRYPYEPLVHTLNPFDTTNPTHDKTLMTNGPVLSWQTASNQNIIYPFEIVYQIMLYKSSDFSSAQTSYVYGDTSFQWMNLERGETYFWKVQAENIVGDKIWSDTKAFYISPTASDVKDVDGFILPKKMVLLPNYPNPFNAYTIVPFVLPKSMTVQFNVFDANGRLVFSDNQLFSSGEHSKRIDLSDLPSGLFFLTVSDGQVVEHQKLMMIK